MSAIATHADPHEIRLRPVGWPPPTIRAMPSDMLRLTAIALFASALLVGCSDSDDASDPAGGTPPLGHGGGPSKNPRAWAGRWMGSVDCEGVYEDANGSQPYVGPVGIEAVFDSNGHLLYPAGEKLVAQTHEGQLDQWVPQGGGVAKRLLARFQDDGDHRFYRFEESLEQTDPNGSFTQTSREEYDLRVEGDVMRGTYKLAIESRTIFSADVGSGISESKEQATCQGQLTRQ